MPLLTMATIQTRRGLGAHQSRGGQYETGPRLLTFYMKIRDGGAFGIFSFGELKDILPISHTNRAKSKSWKSGKMLEFGQKVQKAPLGP